MLAPRRPTQEHERAVRLRLAPPPLERAGGPEEQHEHGGEGGGDEHVVDGGAPVLPERVEAHDR